MFGRRRLASALVLCATACTPRPAPASAQVELLKNWTLCRCLSKVASDKATSDDAAKSAAAYLEMGASPIEVYDKLDGLATAYAQRTYTGSVEGKYGTMKCVDLFHSPELDAAARAAVTR